MMKEKDQAMSECKNLEIDLALSKTKLNEKEEIEELKTKLQKLESSLKD